MIDAGVLAGRSCSIGEVGTNRFRGVFAPRDSLWPLLALRVV